MKTTYIKQLFIALFLLIASAGTASAAQWQLSNGLGAVTPLSFVPGSQDTLRLGIYGNSTAFSAVQVDFYLPTGALLMGEPYAGNIANGHQLTWKQSDDKQWLRIVLHSATNRTMQTAEGELICIPIVWTSDTKSSSCHTANSVLATPGSEAVATTELQVSLTAKVERKPITVNVSNTEQVHQAGNTAALTVTTLPADLKVEVAYYADAEFKTTATPNQIGTYYAKLTFAGNETYLPYEGSAVLVLTDKRPVKITDLPTASAIKQGEYLSASLLTGGIAKEGDHTVGGQFVWLDQGIQANTPGKQTFTAKFYPDNATFYATKDASVTVEVIPTYKVTALAATGGTLTIQGGRTDNTYVKGQELTLTAKADANWKFTGWSDDTNEKATRTITVRADKGYIANFEKIMHKVTISTPVNGRLSVTNEGALVLDGDALQQGSTLKVVTTPDDNYALASLIVNGKALTGDKIVLAGNTEIAATFALRNDAQKTVTIKSENGSLLLYDQQGNAIASGSTVLKDTKLKVITLANTGYYLKGVEINGEEVTDDTYTVDDDDIEAEATFVKKTFTVTASAKTAANTSIEATIKTSLDKSNSAQYGETIMVTEVNATDASFDYLLVNGKRMALNQPIIVTSDINIVAVCTKKVDIKKEYILWPHQELYYNGMSRNFVPFVSQTYAGFSFNVTYIDSVNVAHEKAVDAGTYTVRLTREADRLYKDFDEKYEKGLVIKKSKVAVTAAPTNADANPTTRPAVGANGVKIDTTHLEGSIIQYTITPQGDASSNYEGTVYYWAPNATKKKLQFGSTLRSTNQGWVRVTNGGLAYNADDKGEVEVEEGFTVTLEAVPADGYKFVEWSDGKTKNPIREYPVTEGAEGVTPVFAAKGDLSSIALQSATHIYDGTTPTLKVASNESGFLLSVFSDEKCEHPAELKNAGKYFVRIYRPADAEYKEYNEVVTYTIEQKEITERTLPTASAILVGQTLSESVLEGGSAGIVPGAYAWTDASKKMEEPGVQEVSVTFTPTDANYKPFTTTIKIEVKGTKASETKPEQSTEESTNPEQPIKPEQVPDPVVEQRTDSTAVITWDKVSGAESYRLFLYADKSKKELIATYTFDKDGNLKASNIAFNLQNLVAGKSYYIETVAYDATGKALVTKSIELTAEPTATEEVASSIEVYTSRGMIHIQLSQPMGVRIMNMAGSFVYDTAVAEGRVDIPVASAGIYAVILYERNQLIEVKKVIVR